MQISRRQPPNWILDPRCPDKCVSSVSRAIVIYFLQILPSVNPIRWLDPSPHPIDTRRFVDYLFTSSRIFCSARIINVAEQKRMK